MKSKEQIWDYLVKNAIATSLELGLITSINGYTIETLNDVIYSRTNRRNIEELANN